MSVDGVGVHVSVDQARSSVQLPSTEVEPTAEQTDELCLKPTQGRQVPTGLQQQFELSVVQHVLVGVAGSQCLSMSVYPFIRRSMIGHPMQTCGESNGTSPNTPMTNGEPAA